MQISDLGYRRLIGAAALACAAALIPAAAFAAPAAPAAGHHQAVPAAARSRAGTWTKLPAAPATQFPFYTVGVWTGHEMIINEAPDTFAYRPATNTWKKLARGPAPFAGESTDIGVWTGSRMLVLGLANGAYNPAANTWRRLTTRNVAPLQGAVVAWTGRQVLAFDGVCCLSQSNTGAAYTPATNTWRPIPAAPFKQRRSAMGAWTGKELVVAGGGCCAPAFTRHTTFRDAAAYHPANRSWRKLPPMPAPRIGGTAVWDGKEVLFIGVYRPAGAASHCRAAGWPITRPPTGGGGCPPCRSPVPGSRRCGTAGSCWCGAG